VREGSLTQRGGRRDSSKKRNPHILFHINNKKRIGQAKKLKTVSSNEERGGWLAVECHFIF